MLNSSLRSRPGATAVTITSFCSKAWSFRISSFEVKIWFDNGWTLEISQRPDQGSQTGQPRRIWSRSLRSLGSPRRWWWHRSRPCREQERQERDDFSSKADNSRRIWPVQDQQQLRRVREGPPQRGGIRQTGRETARWGMAVQLHGSQLRALCLLVPIRLRVLWPVRKRPRTSTSPPTPPGQNGETLSMVQAGEQRRGWVLPYFVTALVKLIRSYLFLRHLTCRSFNRWKHQTKQYQKSISKTSFSWPYIELL